jgi:CubicO group peptidase (beta-lactamase class C family)
MKRAVPSLLILFLAACAPPTTEELIEELDATVPGVVSEGNSPSIQAAVVHGDRVIWSRAFGEDASVDTVYMNASVQKSFTAAAVLQLAEKGLVDLDADVGGYIPFRVRHPDHPDVPITVRMLLAHRSGHDCAPGQFSWDTGCAFSPEYRPCRRDLLEYDLEEFLVASLTPDGSNYDPKTWVAAPDEGYRYGLTAYPLLRYMIGQVGGQGYRAYMRDNVFEPLGMTSSGFDVERYSGRHAIPYTRIEGRNVELPLWRSNGYMMRTTAEDMARFMVAMIHGGSVGDDRILEPETVELMRQRTTRFKGLFRRGRDLHPTGHALGTFLFRGGWFGNGGSSPGFQCLWRYHPEKKVGYVILSNVNGILGGEYDSVREEVYTVQDALYSILD